MNKEQFESEMKRAVDKEIEKIPAIVNKLWQKNAIGAVIFMKKKTDQY